MPGRLLLILLSLSMAPALAQNSPPSQTPAPTNARQQQEFSTNFLRGCLKGRTPGVRNQSAYCTCFANAYLGRYNPQTLALIINVSGQLGKGGADLVALMMSPERQACAARN